MAKKKEKSFAYRIIDKVREKIKEVAKNEKELTALHKKNPELAEFANYLDQMITDEAYRELQRIEAKHHSS